MINKNQPKNWNVFMTWILMIVLCLACWAWIIAILV